MKKYRHKVFSLIVGLGVAHTVWASDYPGSFVVRYNYFKSTGETKIIESGSNGSNECYVAQFSDSASSIPVFFSSVQVRDEIFRQEVFINNSFSVLEVDINAVRTKEIGMSFFSPIASGYHQACGEQYYLVPELTINYEDGKLGAVLGGSYREENCTWLSWLQEEISDEYIVNADGMLTNIMNGTNTIVETLSFSSVYQAPSQPFLQGISSSNFVAESKSEIAAHAILANNIISYFNSKDSEAVLEWLNNNYELVANLAHDAGGEYYENNRASEALTDLRERVASNMPQDITSLRGTVLVEMKDSVDIASVYPSENDLLASIYDLFIDEFNEGLMLKLLLELEGED